MISSRSVNLWITKLLIIQNPMAFIEYLNEHNKKVKVLISKKSALRYAINELYKVGYSEKEIAYILNVSEKKVRNTIGKNNFDKFKNLLEFFDPFTALKLSDYLDKIYLDITPNKVKTVFAISLIKKGMGNKEIAKVVGLSDRTIERIRKRLKEGYYEY